MPELDFQPNLPTGWARPQLVPRRILDRGIRISDVSVGIGSNIKERAHIEPPGAIIPPVVESATLGTEIALPAQIDRRDITPIQEELPVPLADWMKPGATFEQIQAGRAAAILAGGIGAGSVPQVYGVISPTALPTRVLQSLPTNIKDIGIMGPLQASPPLGGDNMFDTTTGFWSQVGDIATDYLRGQVFPQEVQQQFLPASAQGGQVQQFDTPIGPVLVCRPKRRRRRKRLATKSDLSDLAALKGILGAGKMMEVWIATH